jgi:hypothetical protein
MLIIKQLEHQNQMHIYLILKKMLPHFLNQNNFHFILIKDQFNHVFILSTQHYQFQLEYLIIWYV